MKVKGKPRLSPSRPKSKGFTQAGRLMQSDIRRAGESRGFAVSKLLTHWTEIMGVDIAKISVPVNVRYGRQGLGATLTLLTTGANAPILEMQKEQIRAKANACYGYNAISKVTVTQTSATGFSEGQVAFGHKSKPADTATRPQISDAARGIARKVDDESLKQALERLGQNIISKSKR